MTRAVAKRSLQKGKYGQFCNEVKNCFRQEGDKIGSRKSHTPDQQQIEGNLNDLLRNWPNISDKAKNEINKLRNEHSACLANMPPHSGMFLTHYTYYLFSKHAKEF